MADTWKSQLHFGDNLDVLRDRVQWESVDLTRLHPSFDSAANRYAIFRENTARSLVHVGAFGGSREHGDWFRANLNSEFPECCKNRSADLRRGAQREALRAWYRGEC